MFDAKNPIYSNEVAAREHLDGIRWAYRVYWPHRGGFYGIRKPGARLVALYTPSAQGVPHRRSEYDYRRLGAHFANSFRGPGHFQSRAMMGLVGRSVLPMCRFSYGGRTNIVPLSY